MFYCFVRIQFFTVCDLFLMENCSCNDYLSCARYNFNKVAQYKQLTLEEAEEKMKNRRKTADGYERWMMKAANNGAAAFGAEADKFEEKENATGGGRGRKKSTGDDDEGHVSDKGEEDEEEEAARKNRLGLNKRSGDDDEEGPRGGDLDLDDDDVEKGWYTSPTEPCFTIFFE